MLLWDNIIILLKNALCKNITKLSSLSKPFRIIGMNWVEKAV